MRALAVVAGLVVLAALTAVVVVPAADDGSAADRPAGPAPVAHVDLAEAQSHLERGDIALVREALGEDGAAIAAELDPAPAQSRRLAAQNGKEFDLLVFATPAQARAAWESLLETAVIEDGGAAMRAVNLVAVFPEPAGDGLYREIKQSLRELAVACGDRAGEPRLRALCFGGGTAPVPPAGDGTDVDELARIGSTVAVGGVRYRVTLARQLNPRIAPDRELVGGRLPSEGSLLFGVVLVACNPAGPAVPTTDRLALVAAFGARERPVELPAANPVAYRPRTLDRGECVPEPDSVAARTLDGRLVLFEIPRERLEERPLGLEIRSPDGADRAAVALDV